MEYEKAKWTKTFTEEQIAKAEAAGSAEELFALAKDEGVELTEDQLDAVSGGDSWGNFRASMSECPYCGGDVEYETTNKGVRLYRCKTCERLCQ